MNCRDRVNKRECDQCSYAATEGVRFWQGFFGFRFFCEKNILNFLECFFFFNMDFFSLFLAQGIFWVLKFGFINTMNTPIGGEPL